MRWRIVLFIVALILPFPFAHSVAADRTQELNPASFVRSLLAAPEHSMDFARAKLAIDEFIDPSIDVDAALAEIDAMAATVRRMLATLPPEAASTSMENMQAIRAFLYESGWWNNGKPFQYDLSDPLGQKFGAQLLPNYLASKKGNCVSMPILFLILGERFDLDVTLSLAPLHVFVKYTDDATGVAYNLETTSGAGATRDAWYREQLEITDEAVANGVYLKTLTRREAVAVIATLVLDHLMISKRYEDAIAVADALLEAYPAHAYALAKKGTAYYRLLEMNFLRKYPSRGDIPADQIAYAKSLYQANQDAFDRAEALGWRMPELN